MKRYVKYVAGVAMLAAMAALLACGSEPEPTSPAPAPPSGGAQPTAAMQEQPTTAPSGGQPAATAAPGAPAVPAPTEAMQEKPTEAVAATQAPEAVPVQAGNRLQTVLDRGKVICASRNDVPGYGSLDASGNNVGFDIDLCRALAAARTRRLIGHRDPPDHRCRAWSDHPVRRSGHAGSYRHLDHLP